MFKYLIFSFFVFIEKIKSQFIKKDEAIKHKYNQISWIQLVILVVNYFEVIFIFKKKTHFIAIFNTLQAAFQLM